MWKNSKKKIVGKKWAHLSDKEDNWSIRFKMEDDDYISTVTVYQVKHAAYKGIVITNPSLETIQTSGISFFDIKTLYNQQTGFHVKLIGGTQPIEIWWSSINLHTNKYCVKLWAEVPYGSRDFTAMCAQKKLSNKKLHYMLNVYYSKCCGDMSLTNNLFRTVEEAIHKNHKCVKPVKASDHILFDLNIKAASLKNFFTR